MVLMPLLLHLIAGDIRFHFGYGNPAPIHKHRDFVFG
jgi:hypothetical protein